MNRKNLFKDFGIKLLNTLILIPVFLVLFIDVLKRSTRAETLKFLVRSDEKGDYAGFSWLVHNTQDEILVDVPRIRLKFVGYFLYKVKESWFEEKVPKIWNNDK